MASIQVGVKSQQKLCAHMRRPLLEEFVRRVTMPLDNTNKTQYIPSQLGNDCINLIKERYDSQKIEDLIVNTVFKKSNKYSDPPDYYIVIAFIVRGVALGHITFHLVYDNCQRINTNSIFHIKNNQSSKRVRRLYIKDDAKLANCIVIYFGDIVMRPHNIGDELYELSECAVDVMNNYLKSLQQHQFSLENRRADNIQLSSQNQSYIADIIKLNARCFSGGMRRQRSSRRLHRCSSRRSKTTVRRHRLR